MDRYKQSAEYQHPVMQKVISTLKENFDKVTKDMSVLLANNLASFVREEEQELLFIASSLDDRVEPEDEPEDEQSDSDDLAIARTTESSAPAHTSERAKMESRLADMEAHFLVIRNQQKRQSELIEEGIQTIREMAKSLKTEKEQTELSREEAEVEIASYELVTHGVNSNDVAVEDEVD
ncbi:hypothetical protein FOC4_g10001157 [Fusarium odoratissimum]|uniref:Uncharacterized protein n=1 Tax=Fusarium oxysporum f. sp. cubense (strain race 4) TaxID=2502994 RepID=N1S4L5_FUSC4|nr:hypothetical protein FOC4_g10001157 [Fusarium odoratissimum]